MRNFTSFTFGCKVNYIETDIIVKYIIKHTDYYYINNLLLSDICIINTCCVTEHAIIKFNKLINHIIKTNNKIKIIVIGCYSKLINKKIYKNNIKLITNFNNRKKIFLFFRNKKKKKKIYNKYSINDSYLKFKRTREFIKIQDGCNFKCNYCIIPKIRGISKSKDFNKILYYIKKKISNNIKEIVLSGINIGTYGLDMNNNKYNLFILLKNICNIKNICRIRLSSIEPNLLTKNIINLFTIYKCLMPHIHIPLQSADDDILKLMNRKYNLLYFNKLIETISNKIKNVTIGSDIIVGYPGEKEENFLNTYNFLLNSKIIYFNVFKYSDRPYTKSIYFGNKVSEKIKYYRSSILIKLCKYLKYKFYIKQINTNRNVLFENKINNNKYIYGYTDNYIKVKVYGNNNLINKIKLIKLIDIDKSGDYMIGNII